MTSASPFIDTDEWCTMCGPTVIKDDHVSSSQTHPETYYRVLDLACGHRYIWRAA